MEHLQTNESENLEIQTLWGLPIKVARDVAEQEFNRFCDEMDVDKNTDRMTAEDSKEFNEMKGILLDALQIGVLQIDGEGLATVYPKKGTVKELKFNELCGADYIAMDNKKDTQSFAKMFAIAGSLTKQPPATFSKLKKFDMKVCLTITKLFLV